MGARNQTVLIVDDQAGIRRLLAEVLTEEGYQILTAANGRDGVEQARVSKPAVILMDMKMPAWMDWRRCRKWPGWEWATGLF